MRILGQRHRRTLPRRHARRGLVVGLGAVAVAGLLASSVAEPPADAATRGEFNGRIAFDSVRNGNRDIYAIAAPGSGVGTPAPDANPARLTTDPGDDAKPSWSPVQPFIDPDPRPTLIAFQRTAPPVAGFANTDIYVLDPAAGSERRLTTSRAADTSPAWASDNLPGAPGELDDPPAYPPLAFEREVNGMRDIFIINPDGSGEQNLTRTPTVDEANPDWSPGSAAWQEYAGGPHLAFDSGPTGARQLSVMALRYDPASASVVVVAVRNVTAGQRQSVNPSWFATNDGDTGSLIDHVAFAGPDRDGGANQINVASYARIDRVTGPAPIPSFPFQHTGRIVTRVLTSHPADDSAPAWSPLGDRIAYESDRDGNPEIYVLDPSSDREDDVNLTRFAGADRNPDWQAPVPRGNETHAEQPLGRRSRERPPPSEGRPSPPGPTPPTPGPTPTPTPRIAGDCTIMGTAGADRLRGTRGADVICGLGGDDVISGLGGDDVLRGGAGGDRLSGGAGSDRLVGAAGADRLVGGAGSDVLLGGPGGDRLNGGAGADRLVAGRGADRLVAREAPPDTLNGGPGRDAAVIDDAGHAVREVEILR